ncbi:hypothetical protein ES703_38124 [subsurface metagenome]
MKWLPMDLHIHVNELVSKYGASLEIIGSYWGINIYWGKYSLLIPLSKNSKTVKRGSDANID